MKLATETITLFHYGWNPETGYDGWTPTVITGVSIHGDTATTVTDTGLVAASRHTIRIPTSDDLTIAQGDVIMRGEVTEKPESGGITVVGVTDNRRGRMPHWKIVGK